MNVGETLNVFLKKTFRRFWRFNHFNAKNLFKNFDGEKPFVNKNLCRNLDVKYLSLSFGEKRN